MKKVLLILTLATLIFNCKGYHYFMDMMYSPGLDAQKMDILGNRPGNLIPPENIVRYHEMPLHLIAGNPELYEASGRNLINPLKDEDAALKRGKDRFDVFCYPCHGLQGKADGPVARRWIGMRAIARPDKDKPIPQEKYPEGRIFHVMTTGFGAMLSYASQIPVDDRWAITKYVKKLQADAMK